MSKINVLVVGAGMYVTGRGTQGLGTVLPALIDARDKEMIGDIFVDTHSFSSQSEVGAKLSEMNHVMGTKTKIQLFPSQASVTDSLAEAMDKVPSPRCAIVATPDDTHCEIIKKLMQKGFHILAVKPLAPTLKEVEELVVLQKEKNLYGMVEFHKRFDKANLKLKENILEGKVGDPLYFIVEYSQRKNIPTQVFRKWVEKTNIFQYLGIHYVDVIYFATGAKPVRVMATGQEGFLKAQKINALDSIQCSVEWMSSTGKKFQSTFHTNWIDPLTTTAMSDQRIKVIGTKGRLESDQKYRGLNIVSDEAGVEEPNPDFCQFYLRPDGKKEIKGYGIDSIHTFLSDVGQIAESKKTPNDFKNIRPTFEQSIIPTKIIEAANLSLKSNSQWIEIK